MKVLPDTRPLDAEAPTGAIRLPNGLIGFANHREFELFYQQDQLPFLWMQLKGPDTVTFVVIEPAGVVPGYEPELFDEDARYLKIESPADAAVLNIVTLRGQAPNMTATVNLAGPIVVNRQTGIGKQVVLSNYSRYSTHHPLVEIEETATASSF